MRFYYFQYRPFAAGSQSMLPDSISNALSRLKGPLFQIYSPGQFARRDPQKWTASRIIKIGHSQARSSRIASAEFAHRKRGVGAS